MSEIIDSIFTSEHLEQDQFGDASPMVLKASVLVLLETMAKQDGSIDPIEYTRVVDLMKQLFACSMEEIQGLIDIGDALKNKYPDTSGLLKNINHYYSTDQRTLMFAAVWKVAEADEQIDQQELQFGNELAELLNLETVHVEEAKKLAKNESFLE